MNKTAFLIPYYNHPKNIKKLINELYAFNMDIIIINDGSDQISRRAIEDINNVLIFDQYPNGGKGLAMKNGFKKAYELGYTHVFQIDADFQHDIDIIHDFLNISDKEPKSIICGNPIYDSSAPKSRVNGRKITDFWVKINTLGADFKDSMCGFRIYPINDKFLKSVQNSKSQRMEFDIEILVNAYKNDIKIIWHDVKVRYEIDGVSHFRMFRDNLLISKMHARHFFALPKYILKKILNARK